MCVYVCVCGGGGGGLRNPSSPEFHKNRGFPSNTGSDPQINHKASKPASSMLGHYRPASETQFKWRFASGPAMAHFKW